MLPEPHPKSSTRSSGFRCGSRNFAKDVADRSISSSSKFMPLPRYVDVAARSVRGALAPLHASTATQPDCGPAYQLSTTEDLIVDDDGGLTITMQRNEPTDPTERANWLPTPDGRFYLALRMYWPKLTALDGTWNPPPVEKIS
ncbi:MAG: DUF1214 domain-containing protein [Actinomycetota bacterium]|nr:DUF1214 domain-containing protein [Actinomycetota bacterium]